MGLCSSKDVVKPKEAIVPDEKAPTTPRKEDEIVKDLPVVDEIDLKQRKKQLQKDIIAAIKRGSVSQLEDILGSIQIDLNFRGMWNNTPLILSALYGHTECALKLIECGVDVDLINEKGSSGLVFACLEGLTEVVKAILKASNNPNLLVNAVPTSIYNSHLDTNMMLTPLLAACFVGDVRIFEVLKEYNVTIEEVCVEHLSETQENNDKNEGGDDKDENNNSNNNSNNDSNENEVKDKKSEKKIASFPHLLLNSCARSGHVDSCRFLIKEGINVNNADDDGCTALWYACNENHVEVIKLLVESGAVIGCLSEKSAPLHLSASKGSVEAIKSLLSKATPEDINQRNSLDQTPLIVAAGGRSAEVVQLLIDAGVDVFAKTKRNQSALGIALKRKRKAIVEVLESHIAAIHEDPNLVDIKPIESPHNPSHYSSPEKVKLVRQSSKSVVVNAEPVVGNPLNPTDCVGEQKVNPVAIEHDVENEVEPSDVPANPVALSSEES